MASRDKMTIYYCSMLSQISIVIPCFKNEKGLETLVQQLIPVCKNLSERFEILLVDDASPDDTWSCIKTLCENYPCLKGIRLAQNMGQHAATYWGLKKADFDLVATLDDDLQNPPAEIAKLTEKLEAGFDVVYGVPARKNHDSLRKGGSRLFRFFLKILGLPFAEYVSSFRLIDRTKVADIDAVTDKRIFLDILFLRNKMRLGFVEVAHDNRISGRSSYSFFRLAKLAIDCWQASLISPKRQIVTDTDTIADTCTSPQTLI